jgi:hypothetical protein
LWSPVLAFRSRRRSIFIIPPGYDREWRFGGEVARSEYQERVAAAGFSFVSPNAARDTVALHLSG